MEKSPSGFKQSLGLIDATMLVAGSMIGSGIFIVSADMRRVLGSGQYLLLAWVLSSIFTTIAALSYGELAGMLPKAGGQYVYLREAYGNLIAFLYGWTVFTVAQTGLIAAVAVGFAKFVGVFFPILSPDNIIFNFGFAKISAASLVAIISLIVLTLINNGGVKNGKWVQTIFTFTKIAAVICTVLIVFFFGFNKEILLQNLSLEGVVKDNSGNFFKLTGWALVVAFATASVGSLFSSDAWNNVTFIAGEIKNPKRNIPLSLFLGTTLVGVLYFLTNLAYLSVLPLQGNELGSDVISRGIQYATNDRVGTAVASVVIGDIAVYVMAGLIVISTFGCNNGLILAGARVSYTMARDGLFFKKAGELNSNAVPGFALWAQFVWASVLCLSGTYGALLDYTIFAALLFYVLTILGVFILRKKMPDAERPYRAWGYPVLPFLYIIFASFIAVILLFYKSENTIPGLIIVLLGVPIYYWQKSKMQHEKN